MAKKLSPGVLRELHLTWEMMVRCLTQGSISSDRSLKLHLKKQGGWRDGWAQLKRQRSLAVRLTHRPDSRRPSLFRSCASPPSPIPHPPPRGCRGRPRMRKVRWGTTNFSSGWEARRGYVAGLRGDLVCQGAGCVGKSWGARGVQGDVQGDVQGAFPLSPRGQSRCRVLGLRASPGGDQRGAG